MTLVLLVRGEEVVASHAGIWSRLRARVFCDRLDRELASGITPDCSVAHSLRARYLERPDQRAVIAGAIRRLLSLASQSHPSRSGGPTPIGGTARRCIRACSSDLARLADRVGSNEPVSVRGLALTRILVTDGAGPLHYGTDEESLRSAYRHAFAMLDPDVSM